MNYIKQLINKYIKQQINKYIKQQINKYIKQQINKYIKQQPKSTRRNDRIFISTTKINYRRILSHAKAQVGSMVSSSIYWNQKMTFVGCKQTLFISALLKSGTFAERCHWCKEYQPFQEDVRRALESRSAEIRSFREYRAIHRGWQLVNLQIVILNYYYYNILYCI